MAEPNFQMGSRFDPKRLFTSLSDGRVFATAIYNRVLDWGRQPQTREMMRIMVRIAVIDYVVEALIMMTFAHWQIDETVLLLGLTDATVLTLTAAPFIYFWVAEPFVRTTRESKAALAAELQVRERQAAQLETALADLRALYTQNEQLRLTLQQSSKANEEIKERMLQKIGADLHDGPAQLLVYCMLRLNRLSKIIEKTGDDKGLADLRQVHAAVSDSLREVRNTSAGLSLPSLNSATLEDAIRRVVTQHQEHTDTQVALELESLPAQVPQSIKISVYRFVQEGLSNAFRHAKGKGQKVSVHFGEQLRIIVSDAGDGFDTVKTAGRGLGLSGMQARIVAVGGTLDITSCAVSGTALTATFGEQSLRHQE